MGTVPPGTGPLSPSFTGIDPGLMDGFVTEVEHARGVIGENLEAIRRVFAANGVPATSLDPIGEVERWLDERLPDLRRRSKMAHDIARLPDWSPGAAGALVPYEEKGVLPATEARRLGTELAAQYKKINPDVFFDPGLDEKHQKIVDALAAHAHDPEFTTAFFAGLGLNRTLQLPERLRHALQEGDDSAVDTVSRALGTAVSAGGAAAAGFAAIANGLKQKATNHDDQEAIGDLLSAGRFPTEWLAQVVATQIFLPGDKSVGATLTPYLKALSHDPAATRLAISLATRDSPLPRDTLAKLLPPQLSLIPKDQRPDLATFLNNLNNRARVNDTSADAFGRLLASASGAYDEKDGHHSDPAARFAFTLITTADDFKLAEPTRIHLSEIAGTYATEIAQGANFGDANHLLPSAFGEVKSQVSGLRPTFRLSPEDTYRFIQTFTNKLENQAPFQAGMGNLARRLTGEESPNVAGPRDIRRLDDVFALLGSARGLQLAARDKWDNAKEQAEKEAGKAFSWLSGNGLGAVGLIVPGGPVGAAAWTALSTAWSTYDTYKPETDSELEKAKRADKLETLGRQHSIAQSLMNTGLSPKISPRDYQATHPSDATITDSNGDLLPFSEILKQREGLNTLDGWFIANGMGSSDDSALGAVSRKLADIFDGRKVNSKARTES
ncbi:hypothetical protein Ssi03_13940 [Sphaerisporangium siamense]|uniref:Uncharacterized protein n=1 Tax=Sphaerisporangium siamense TaxID=795645 RepID=A0A7W7D9N2_9ACTN|nr:hypothetical protein [Sphaerisporangium siamense]MBB4702840.1 hypothetical protein [Sphaerisporangium siamense]GII83404.1 hypothetical protein Ssi03_13940 [Sphaerisporangium siamense]